VNHGRHSSSAVVMGIRSTSFHPTLKPAAREWPGAICVGFL
jgi:hypothetical protein